VLLIYGSTLLAAAKLAHIHIENECNNGVNVNKLRIFVLCCSLLLRFTEDRFDPEQSATIGQLNFSAVHQFSVSKYHLLLICFSNLFQV